MTDFRAPQAAGESPVNYSNRRADGLKGKERLIALDEKTGKILWTYEWDSDYTGLMQSYAIGPRATPTVDGDRVYVQGAMGRLLCLNSATGALIWQKDYVKDYGLQPPVWGITSAPLVDGTRLIAIVGGQGEAKVIAFDKRTGKEVWKALPTDTRGPGYGQPVLIKAGGAQQLIVWHPSAVSSLDPATGKVNWEQAWNQKDSGMTVATPVQQGSRLFLTSFYVGPMMIRLDSAKPVAALDWKGTSESEINTDGLHSLISTPVIDGDHIYGVCSYGQFRCLDARTGKRVWETLDVTKEKARWATAFLVRNGDRYFINNDRGELIIAKLSPEGYKEISRTALIKPTSTAGIGRRELGAVNWSHPAYAGGAIYARNDEEIIAASLR